MARRRTVGRPPRPVDAPSPWAFGGMAGMACALFLYGSSVLVAPWWAVVLLLLVWVAAFRTCLRWWHPYPRRLAGIAAGTVLVWFVTLVAGGAFLGWSPGGA